MVYLKSGCLMGFPCFEEVHLNFKFLSIMIIMNCPAKMPGRISLEFRLGLKAGQFKILIFGCLVKAAQIITPPPS